MKKSEFSRIRILALAILAVLLLLATAPAMAEKPFIDPEEALTLLSSYRGEGIPVGLATVDGKKARLAWFDGESVHYTSKRAQGNSVARLEFETAGQGRVSVDCLLSPEHLALVYIVKDEAGCLSNFAPFSAMGWTEPLPKYPPLITADAAQYLMALAADVSLNGPPVYPTCGMSVTGRSVPWAVLALSQDENGLVVGELVFTERDLTRNKSLQVPQQPAIAAATEPEKKGESGFYTLGFTPVVTVARRSSQMVFSIKRGAELREFECDVAPLLEVPRGKSISVLMVVGEGAKPTCSSILLWRDSNGKMQAKVINRFLDQRVKHQIANLSNDG